MASLLEKALKVQPVRKISKGTVSDDMLELAVAYAKHEVTSKQAAAALEVNEQNAISKMKYALASGVRAGKLVLR